MTLSLRALLGGIVDYAGFFPPAGLDVAATVRNYFTYLESADRWMLGRLVVPFAEFDEFAQHAARYRGGATWHVSAVLGQDFARELETIVGINQMNAGIRIDSAEVRAPGTESIAEIAAANPAGVRVFVEIPSENDPRDAVRDLAKMRLSAKIRTGGLTPGAIPGVPDVARFIRACYGAGVAFKATAGLHHPLRAQRALTYEANAPRGVMHGFLNVFLTALFCYNGLSAVEAEDLMRIESTDTLAIDDDGIAWRNCRMRTDEIKKIRRRFAMSFGSCSFVEPIDELTHLKLI